MTPKEKTKEIERICNKINAYFEQKKEEVNELNSEVKRIQKETNNTIPLMIESECKKKNVSEKIVSIILKDVKFIDTKGKEL
ncbi:MAG: hypothetical protein RLZZ605_1413 [Bacteroidota bacterium]|jgi:septal ring factor EnvC (AmiA/AmiB activator)